MAIINLDFRKPGLYGGIFSKAPNTTLNEDGTRSIKDDTATGKRLLAEIASHQARDKSAGAEARSTNKERYGHETTLDITQGERQLRALEKKAALEKALLNLQLEEAARMKALDISESTKNRDAAITARKDGYKHATDMSNIDFNRAVTLQGLANADKIAGEERQGLTPQHYQMLRAHELDRMGREGSLMQVPSGGAIFDTRNNRVYTGGGMEETIKELVTRGPDGNPLSTTQQAIKQLVAPRVYPSKIDLEKYRRANPGEIRLIDREF